MTPASEPCPLEPPLSAPALVGERVRLRELRESDAPALFRIHADAAWVWAWGIPVHAEVEATRRMIAELLAAQREGRQLRWALCVAGSDEPVGALGFCRFVREHHRAEISYVQAREACGRGLMSEALLLLARFAFTRLGLHTIEAGVDPRNLPSQRILERLGFRREGYLRENYCLAGRFHDTILYSLLCGEEARPGRLDGPASGS